MKRIILLTGPSGIGKTSVFRRTLNELKEKGCKVGGMICHEVREAGARIGFEIMDLSTGQRGWLAHINQQSGPKVGKYTVNLTDLEILGASSILNAVKNADVLAIDEIGPMELKSSSFNNALIQAVKSSKPIVGTIHYTLNTPLVDRIKKREDTEILKVTYKNRENLQSMIIEKLNEFMIC